MKKRNEKVSIKLIQFDPFVKFLKVQEKSAHPLPHQQPLPSN